MYKLITFLLFFAFLANAQTKPAVKKPIDKKKTATSESDSVKTDLLKEEVIKLPREFAVYTKKARTKKERTKLCINLVCKDTVLNYCMNDSLCTDPETSKILFEQRKGDTLYVLVFIDGFSKPDAASDDGRCSAGKETKLVFCRWNTKTNQAKWKQRNISSCLRGLTNMSQDAVTNWDKTSALVINYHRGSSIFVELKFDPEKFELGLQSIKDNESR
jgi:hypothetical protein